VFAESAGENKGSTFTLELPRVKGPALSDRTNTSVSGARVGAEG
jgi:hypothetical protein